MSKFVLAGCSLFWIASGFAASLPALSCKPNQPNSANSYQALLWYRTAAEPKALYRQVFANGVDTLVEAVQIQGLKAKKWGVIFALDGTLLDNSNSRLIAAERCSNLTPEEQNLLWAKADLAATAGAADASCQIQENGGYVIVVSNRDGSRHDNYNLNSASAQNLKLHGICYDNLILANDADDRNKNPRFSAAASGDYENVANASNKKLPALTIVGFFGNDIQDFPNFKQSTASRLPDDSEELSKFGEEYFMLPNPLQGSWQANQFR